MVNLIIMEPFCLSIKVITAVFYQSLEAVHIFGGEKRKIIIFGHKIFLKEFSHPWHSTRNVANEKINKFSGICETGDFTGILNKRISLKFTPDFENHPFYQLLVKACAFFGHFM